MEIAELNLLIEAAGDIADCAVERYAELDVLVRSMLVEVTITREVAIHDVAQPKRAARIAVESSIGRIARLHWTES